MLFLAKTIGIIILVSGIVFLLKPKLMEPYCAFWMKGNRFYFGGVIRIVFGLILLFAASEAQVTWVFVTLGLLCLLGGIALFFIGKDKFVALIEWWKKLSQTAVRIWCGVVILIGALIIYSA